MDDVTLLEADDAYQKERARWGMRYNKMRRPPQHEIFRTDDVGVPDVQAMCGFSNTAIHELEERRAIAAMRAAAAILTPITDPFQAQRS